MQKTSDRFIPRGPNPFDDSARGRLSRMGILARDGQPDHAVMTVFAAIFAGLFFDDVCDYCGAEDLPALLKTFRELSAKRDYRHMYLLISIQYDRVRKSLPDPVWWLAGDSAAVREFMTLFLEHFERLVDDPESAGQGGDEK